jgi:thiosulfate dehydrogenase [quinone] large subunit
VIQHTSGTFVAFDAICPHAGCTVAYKSASNIIACPCHGSEFSPRTGAVITGPATSGLTPITVIKGSNGNLYVV